MRSLFRSRIVFSLTIVFIVLGLFLLVTGIASVYLVAEINQDFSSSTTRTNIALLGLQIRSESQAMVISSLQYINPVFSLDQRQSIRNEIRSHRLHLDQYISQAVDLTVQDDLRERTQLARIQQLVVNLSLQTNRLVEAFDEELELGDQTTALLSQLTMQYEQPLSDEISDFLRYENDRAQLAQENARQKAATIYSILGLMAVFALIFTGLAVTWVFVRIANPLNDLISSVVQLRNGNLTYPIKVHSEDEIGLLGRTLQEMAEKLSQTLSGLLENVNALRKTQEALTHSEALYRGLFDGIPIGMFRSTPSGELLSVNPALVRMLGFPNADELLSTNATNLYADPNERQMWLNFFEHNVNQGQFDVLLQRFDGTSFWARENSRVVRDNELNILYIEGSLEDISKSKEAELLIQNLNTELEQRIIQRTADLENTNRELEAFVYSISHDLRAPLRSIDSFNKILLEDHGDSLNSEAKEYINIILRATYRMGRLIDDLLSLSRVSRIGLNREKVDISAIADEVVQTLVQQDPQRQISVSIQSGMYAEADPGLLRVVIDNLIANAWKFTRYRDEPVIEIGSNEIGPDRVFFVRDNGAGFDMQFADKLFEAFQRMHPATEFEGNGIGLATVQRIVQRHGGRIWAESAPQQGATFYFTLPSA